ncbi:MAG: dephospho-CoA kinase [Planctomycetota bacterium]
MPEPPPPSRANPPPFRPAKPVVIGILGGVAAGKSAVASAFAAHGLAVVDADQEARAVTAEPAVLAELARVLGPELVRDGQLDRAALAALVFRDGQARSRLEAITHPRIRDRVLAAVAAAHRQGNSVLLDAPLLLEGGLIARCNHVVFVAAADAVRAARAATRGWDASELARREAAQAPLPDKRRAAAFTIDNDGDLATMRNQVATLLERLAKP